MCENPQIKDKILKEIQDISKKNKLTGLEIAKNIHLESELFSVENDILTPTFKIKRHQAKEKYKETISHLYSTS